MPATAPPTRHRLRWIALAVVAVLAVLLLVGGIHLHRLLQPQRFTELLENNLAAANLKLRLSASAEPMLFPHPGVRLQGFSLANANASTPMLQAAGATIAIPWRALLHGDIAIERVEIRSPRLDLDEMEALLARLPHRAGPPRLPTITTGISMSQGTLVRGGEPILFDFSIDTGALAPGQGFGLVASARNASGQRFNAALATVPTPGDGTIELKALNLNLAEQHGARLHLEGTGSWRGGERLALSLQGTLAHAALAPAQPGTAATPAAAATTAAPGNRTTTDTVMLEVTPARTHTPLSIALKLDGEDAHVDLHVQPTEFGNWWKQLLATTPGQAPAPLPFTGQARVRQLDLGWLKASGLSFEAGPDLAPASAASIPPPPPASTTH